MSKKTLQIREVSCILTQREFSAGSRAKTLWVQHRSIFSTTTALEIFCYLQSRYYDPEICRFINADSYAPTGQSYLGYNGFAYCGNDPLNRTDADGEFWDTVFDIVSLGFSIADVIQNPSDPWAWAGLVGDVVDLVPFVTGVGELTKAAGAVADIADVIDDVHDTARALDNIEDAVDTGGDIARKADFYVTPTGEAIPASRAGFEENLSKLELKDGKYINNSGDLL